jgi:hypothetical protein
MNTKFLEKPEQAKPKSWRQKEIRSGKRLMKWRLKEKYKESMKQKVGLHACNCSCWGGGDKEDNGLRSIWAKCLQDPISTKDWAQWHAPVIPSV